MEIINLVNPNIPNQLPAVDVPKIDDGSVGGLLQGKTIICGGIKNGVSQQKYFVIGQPSKNMLQKRSCASSVVLNPSTLWVVGGDSDNEILSSTELITLEKPLAKGTELPFKIKGHGMVMYTGNAIYIIGGVVAGSISVSRDTWIVDPSNTFEIKKGPSLKEGRSYFSCGKMLSHGKVYIVVAGGECGSDTVEILDSSSDQGWTSGIVKSNHFMQWKRSLKKILFQVQNCLLN